jgi:hypothetical protein
MAATEFMTMMLRRDSSDWEQPMRFIIGMIFGAALMLVSAYLHDTKRVQFGPPQAFVNWDIVFGMIGR